MKKKHFIRAISILSVACIILTVSTVVYADRARKYKFATQIVYEKALSDRILYLKHCEDSELN